MKIRVRIHCSYCVVLVYYFVQNLLKFVKYKTFSEYSTLIGQFPSKSVKVSRKIGWSSIPSKSIQVLRWTLIKVFFDCLHYQSSRQKLWPSFLVQRKHDTGADPEPPLPGGHKWPMKPKASLRREAPKGGGWGRGSPPAAGGGPGPPPRKFFEKLHQNGAFWVHFEVINTRFLH